MATFVLVHGAWQGGWCWSRVAALLRQAGHEVFTPSLTGLGDRAHLLNDQVDLDMHIHDVLQVLESEELSDAVLCGHSYGGMVITGVADKASERIRSLVYVDALVPDDGQNVIDLLPAEAGSELRQSARTTGSGFRVAPNSAEAYGVNAGDRAWVDRRSVDHPLKSFEQPIRLDGAWKQVHRRLYVLAAGWSPGVGRPFFERAQQEAGWDAISLPCGHYAMIDAPKELTEILIASI